MIHPAALPMNVRCISELSVSTQEIVDAAAKRVKEIGEFGADSLYNVRLFWLILFSNKLTGLSFRQSCILILREIISLM